MLIIHWSSETIGRLISIIDFLILTIKSLISIIKWLISIIDSVFLIIDFLISTIDILIWMINSLISITFFFDINHWLAHHYTGRRSELRHSTLWHSSNSYPINIYPAQKSWRHTNWTQSFTIRRSRTRGIEDKRAHHKNDIRATQSFPKQTLITDIRQKDISNLGIKHREMLHTHNRHTVIEYTDI